MFALAIAIARAQERTVKAIRVRVGRVKRWGGYIVLAVGLWVLASAAFPDLFRQVFF